MKKSFHENTWRKDDRFRLLCKALLSCKTESEMANFLRDVATLSELNALSERLQAAGLLYHKIPYRAVSRMTGASTATVTRIASFLKNGKGYTTILKRILKKKR